MAATAAHGPDGGALPECHTCGIEQPRDFCHVTSPNASRNVVGQTSIMSRRHDGAPGLQRVLRGAGGEAPAGMAMLRSVRCMIVFACAVAAGMVVGTRGDNDGPGGTERSGRRMVQAGDHPGLVGPGCRR